MATRVYKWRTAPAYAEGTKSVYVHSATGSDLFGDGTRNNPYQTWGRAYRSGTNPTEIISVGRFSEMMADGNHSCTIKGDYYGAAVFDGAGYYVVYGFRHTNLIIINTGIGNMTLLFIPAPYCTLVSAVLPMLSSALRAMFTGTPAHLIY